MSVLLRLRLRYAVFRPSFGRLSESCRIAGDFTGDETFLRFEAGDDVFCGTCGNGIEFRVFGKPLHRFLIEHGRHGREPGLEIADGVELGERPGNLGVELFFTLFRYARVVPSAGFLNAVANFLRIGTETRPDSEKLQFGLDGGGGFCGMRVVPVSLPIFETIGSREPRNVERVTVAGFLASRERRVRRGILGDVPGTELGDDGFRKFRNPVLRTSGKDGLRSDRRLNRLVSGNRRRNDEQSRGRDGEKAGGRTVPVHDS